MDLRVMGLDPNVIETLHELLDFSDASDKSHHAPSRAYIRDSKAMAATPADVKEYPDAFVFVLDMPGLKPDQIKVQVEEDNKLVKEKEPGVKYLTMERRLGKYLKKFALPENVNHDKISAVYQDGVLTVTIAKKPPPEPKKPKAIQVQVN
ncbi:17.1 kDa class II heat shock protein [Fagus crenata]